MYRYANQKEVKELDEWCRKILHEVQEEVRDYFTFDIRIIGSGDRRLVTQNENEPFDLDYNIILQKDKKDLIDNPKQIKEIFTSRFNKVLKDEVKQYKHVCDSTSVITIKLTNDYGVDFSFDVAIVVEGNDGYTYRLINDKNTNRYIWNQVKNSKNSFQKFQDIKKSGLWMNFKNRYLELKNMHLSKQDDVKSFSIFLETLNEYRYD